MARHPFREQTRDPRVDAMLADAERYSSPVTTTLRDVSFRLSVGEMTTTRADMVLAGEQADVVYTDPPWGSAILHTFYRMAGNARRPSWPDFLTTFCAVVAASIRPGGHVFVEMGTRWVDELAAAMATCGLPERQRWDVRYGKPLRPNVLWYSGPGVGCDPTDMSGEPMTQHVIDAVAAPGALVFDPCCGKGMTARCALRTGMRFAGVEINPDRAAVTRKWVERWQAQR